MKIKNMILIGLVGMCASLWFSCINLMIKNVKKQNQIDYLLTLPLSHPITNTEIYTNVIISFSPKLTN